MMPLVDVGGRGEVLPPLGEVLPPEGEVLPP